MNQVRPSARMFYVLDTSTKKRVQLIMKNLANLINGMSQEPLSNGKTMNQLVALYKRSKKKASKDYWRGAIDGLAGRAAYVNWLRAMKKKRPKYILPKYPTR